MYVLEPTTASMEINDKNIPISFTLCKIFYDKFDGKFSDHTHTSLKYFSIFYNKTKTELMDDTGFEFEFFSYFKDPMMCKEYDLSEFDKNLVKLSRDPSDNNLHLYIHPTGMFHHEEFKVKYPSRLFRTRGSDTTNINTYVLSESYDISKDPHWTCSAEIHQDCTHKQIISMFNASLGCTYPIQRYVCFELLNLI